MLQTNYLKIVFLSLCLAVSSIGFAQKTEKKELPKHQKEAIQQVFTGNEAVSYTHLTLPTTPYV